MQAESRTRRSGVVALLAVALTALGVFAFPQHVDVARGTSAAAEGSYVAAVAPPVRAVGRVVAEPPPSTHGGSTPFGVVPDNAVPVALPRLAVDRAETPPAPRAAHRPSIGGRAPPLRQSDL
jgi:hypothetical protein